MREDAVGVMCFGCDLYYDYLDQRLYYDKTLVNITYEEETIAIGSVEYCWRMFKNRAFI